MELDKVFDAIVVGTGAAGGWAAKELTEAGLDVLVLEAGPRLDPVKDFPLPEKPDVDHVGLMARVKAVLQSQHVQATSVAFTSLSRHLYVNDRENPYTTPRGRPFRWIRGRQVGGKLHLWGRIALRMSEFDFKAASYDGWGEDWPIGYEDLAPYYDKVETFHGLYGSNAGLDYLPDGRYIGELSFTSGERAFKDVVEQVWPDRRVLTPRQLKHDPGRVPMTIRAAEQTGRMTLRDNSVVARIVTDSTDGRATGVEFADRLTKKRMLARANIVVLGACTIETLRIMWNSGSARHPNGLGNSSDWLGRGITDHCIAGQWGPVPQGMELAPPSEDPYDLGTTTGMYVPRFRNLRGKTKSDKFIRGYGMEGGIGRVVRDRLDPTATTAEWSLAAFGETLSRPENRVTVNHKKKDAWGIPVAHIDCVFGDNEREMMADGLEAIEAMAKAAGLVCAENTGLTGKALTSMLRKTLVPGAVIHELGGARMGNDPARSVLDPFGRCWDTKNVFVADGAAFVSSGCQNSTLTIMALAARCCAHIAQEYKDGRLP